MEVYRGDWRWIGRLEEHHPFLKKKDVRDPHLVVEELGARKLIVDDRGKRGHETGLVMIRAASELVVHWVILEVR